jgi:hypothetical protein
MSTQIDKCDGDGSIRRSASASGSWVDPVSLHNLIRSFSSFLSLYQINHSELRIHTTRMPQNVFAVPGKLARISYALWLSFQTLPCMSSSCMQSIAAQRQEEPIARFSHVHGALGCFPVVCVFITHTRLSSLHSPLNTALTPPQSSSSASANASKPA